MTLRRLRDVELVPSPGFGDWLAGVGSVALVRAHELAFLGFDDHGALVLDGRRQRGPTAISIDERARLWLAADRALWRFVDAAHGVALDGHDRVLIPQVGWVTGYLGVTDLDVGPDGAAIVASSRLSSLLRVDEAGVVEPTWRPPFVTETAADERCMLSGLAMVDGRPGFVTAAAETDEPEAWRQHRRDGGVVVDVDADEVVARGLSLPHAPRWHDGRLWVVDTGAGEVGVVDLERGRFEPVVELPAFARCGALVGDHLVVGGSARRDDGQWADLRLAERLAAQGRARPTMGLFVVDLRRGELVHTLTFEGSPRELYDVAVLPGARRPLAIDPDGDEAQQLVSYDVAAADAR